MFLRFYGTTQAEITEMLKQMRALGHSFTDTREPITKSVNALLPPGENTEVKLTFESPEKLEAFRADPRMKDLYRKYATKKYHELVEQQKGSPTYRHG